MTIQQSLIFISFYAFTFKLKVLISDLPVTSLGITLTAYVPSTDGLKLDEVSSVFFVPILIHEELYGGSAYC